MIVHNIEDEKREMHECLDVMARQVKELNRIVEEFLQLSRQLNGLEIHRP